MSTTRNIKHVTEPFSHKLCKTHTVAWAAPRLWNLIIVPSFPLIEHVPASKNIIKKISKTHFLQTYAQ